MALTWSAENVRDWRTVCQITDPENPATMIWSPVTIALVWLSISTGIRQITPQNADEVYARINLLERVGGPHLIRAQREDGTRPEGHKAFITPEEVRVHIGLSTNASNKTRAQFLKTFEADLRDARNLYNRETLKEVNA